MDPEIVVRGRGDFSRLNADLGRTESRFGRLGRAVRAGLITGAVAGGAAMIKLGTDAVQAASLSQQSIGATESVFGRYADVVIRRSEQAADAVGLSANEYRELANTTGAMLQTAGTPLRKVTELTDQLNRRAADMAATFGGETSEAVQAISSLLRGEADPIERYGISIKQSDINARLAAKGLDDLEGSARKQAEQQERLALLFQQSSRTAGQFARESDTLAGAQQRLDAKVDDVQARFGELLLPAMTGVTNWAGDELVPALEDLAGWLERNKGEIRETSGELKDGLLPVLQTSADVVQSVAGFLADLPGPVKEFGIQAGLAASVVPRLMSAADAASGALGGFVTNVRSAETRTAALGRAARTAAGVGGLLALVQGAREADEATGDILDVLGGASLGFSVGGPWGAAVGAIGGVTKALIDGEDQSDRYKAALALSEARVDSFKDSLEAATGAITSNTRATALMRLEEEGALDAANRLGISQRLLVSATLGNERAARRVKAAYDQVFTGGNAVMINGQLVQLAGNTTALSADSDLLAGAIGDVSRELQQATREERQAIRASQDLTGKLKGIPRNVRIKVEERGVPVTVRGLAVLAQRADNLSNKDIRILIEAADLPYTVRQVRNFQKDLDETDRKRPKPQLGMDDRQFRDVLRFAVHGVEELDRKRANPKASIDRSQIPADAAWINAALGRIPDEIIDVWIRYHDPGRPGGDGGNRTPRLPATEPLERGIDALSERVQLVAEKAGRDILSKLLSGITGDTGQVRAALGRLTDYIEKRINLKDDKAERARERRVLKSLDDEYRALIRIGKTQDENNRKLERARAHLEEVRQYVDQVRESFISVGDVTQLGVLDDGTVSGTLLLDQLRDKVAQAQQFAALIRDLTDDVGPKINKETLEQLLAAGPAAGLAAAQALVTGGAAAINEVNSLTGQLAAAGQQLGIQMSDQFYDVGLSAAEGLVAGLESESARLDRVAERMGRRLAAAVRRALRSRSPSAEFRDIGTDVIRGLTIGLDDTYVRAQGRKVAASLVEGFSRPQLSADAVAAGAGPIEVNVKLTAEQASQLARGKELSLTINAGQARGVRRIAVTGR